MPRKKKDITNYWLKPFPERLKNLMDEKGVKQPQVAAYLGISPQAVSNYILGKSSPDWEGLAALAKYFGVSSDYLLGLTDRKTPDLEIRETCECVNLSEQAVTKLSAMKNYKGALYALESLIKHDDILHTIGIYLSMESGILVELHDRQKIEEHVVKSVEIQLQLAELRKMVRQEIEAGVYPGQ